MQATGIEQVGDQAGQPIAVVIDVRQELPLLLGLPVNVGLHQARHRGLDTSQRGAQVVRDRPEQAGAQRISLSHHVKVGGFLTEPTCFEHRRRLMGERPDELMGIGPFGPPGEHEHGVGVDDEGVGGDPGRG